MCKAYPVKNQESSNAEKVVTSENYYQNYVKSSPKE
jgi:hypothetical protein